MSSFNIKMKKIGFIGTGNMAFAICEGLIKSTLISPENIFGSDVFDQALQKFQKLAKGIKILKDNKELVKQCDILVISIKPQQAEMVLGEIGYLTNNKLIISIMAGKTIGVIANYLKQPLEKIKIIRVIPNTPLMCGLGASGIVGSSFTTAEEIEATKQLFSCSGIVTTFTNENLLDAITGVSGSGPAYVFAFIEALAASGERFGLSKDVALRFAIQTVYGAGKLASEKLQSDNIHPSQLREMVTSKGGTTEAALKYFKSKNFDGIIDKAVEAAVQRSKQLSKL